jgi:hypothetical protein
LRIDKVQWDLLAFAGWWLLTLIVYNPKIISDPPHFLSLLFLLAYLGFLSRFCWLWLNNTAPALTGSISIIGMVFTLLFTTFFTVGHEQQDFLSRINSLVNALWNGAFGGLQYWWEQHDVRRGGQPWYYYLLELPANEMVSFFFSAVAMVYYGLFNRKNLPLFLSYWYLGSFALFSWAGEKMPWLILHPLLPSLLLTAYFVGQIIDSKPVKEAVRFARISALFLFGLFLTYSLHSAVLLTFYHEADPVEPLVYTQSGPDVLEVERIIRKISYGETGGPNPNAPVGPTATEAENRMHDGLSLTIQDYCSWPFSWYLRDFPKRNHPRPIPDPPDNPIVMTGFESDSDNLSYPILSKAGYVNRKYKLRVWWAPSWFKKGFPGSEMNSTLFFNWFFSNFIPLNPRPDMVDWNDLKKWILYRQVWSDLGSYNMRLWVRGDLAQKYDFTPQNRTDIPDDFSQAQAMPVTIVAPPGNKKKRAR